MKARQILCAVVVVLLVSLACNLVQPTRAAPTPRQPSPETPTAIPLEPLDRRDSQSALRWLLYGIEHKDMNVFRTLTAAEFRGYANYIEGGDPISREEFLQDLEARLTSSQIACIGYEGDDQTIRVWTKGWSPAWEIAQLCYDRCNTLEPPYQSSNAGFFLYNVEGEWWLRLNFVNTPEKYYFSPYTLTPCDAGS